MFSQRDPAVPGTCAVITTSCKDVEAAVRFLNYAYTEEGNNLFQFGIEGESFEMVDGAPKYTEKVLNSPDSIPFTQAIGQYAFTPNHGPYIQGKEFCVQSYNESQNAALLTWPQSDYKNHYVPPLSVAAESATRYSTIRSEVDTYVSENFVLFVSGEKSLDEFDSYLETLKGMGIEDMISIYQAAFDVYNR